MKEVKKFFKKLQVQDTRHSFNLIDMDELEYTYEGRIKYIELIAVSKSIIGLLEESKIFKIYEVVNTNH